ncbi:MAG: serine/threonine-protein kinase [Acidobacteria bacterium]|nr:serine/threonine-protein kinase [Acidobacteriota bacterium]
MPIPAGTLFDECEVLAPLGAGGMGEVYRARDNRLGREVAIKVLPMQLSGDPERLRRFEQEARAAAALSHPNILVVYRFGSTAQGVSYVVTELLQGQTLRERLEQGPIPVRKTIDFALQIARGLSAAHERGIVHRDLKPDNLYLTRDGIVKILDFGLAKLLSGNLESVNSLATLSSTQPGVVLGTMGYMSPEQVRAQSVDHRSDIFSLGAILYEMLSGKRAFSGATPADTMSAILKDDPPELALSVANLPPALGKIVHRCLEKDPVERFQSARDLAFNLELLTREESGSGSALKAAAMIGNSRRWKLPVLATLALLVAAATGFMLAGWLYPSSPERPPVLMRRLTDFVGVEESPALSPDGETVAFIADVGGHRQLWVRLLSGGSPLQLTHDEADHQFPRWSADSSAILYFSPSANPEESGKIWEVPALGGTPRPIASSFTGGDVSHDGKSLAYFRSFQEQTELVVANRDGSDPRLVSQFPSTLICSDLRWSPDDRLLGFQKGRTFDYDIFTVPVDKAGKSLVEPRKITQDSNPLNGFAWLPDGSGIVYSSSRGDTVLYLPIMNLWSVRLDGKKLRQLTFGEISFMSPDMDRAGNLVATRSNVQFNIWKFPVGGDPKENVARAVQITHQTGVVQTPSIGATEREIAYLSNSGGHGNIWALDTQTGRDRQITFEQDSTKALGVPVWSPDGRHISYVTRSRESWNVDQWIINADGTNPRRVSVGGGWATWSPDGSWLYYAEPRSQSGGYIIKKVTADGANSVRVHDEGERPAVSPDGDLYYTKDLPSQNGAPDLQIFRAHPETADGQPLARIPGSRLPWWLIIQPVLSRDGKALAMALVDGSVTNIWLQPTAGGELRRVTDFGGQATYITRRMAWSLDGKSIYAAIGKGEADIVLFSNLVRQPR